MGQFFVPIRGVHTVEGFDKDRASLIYDYNVLKKKDIIFQ